MSSQTHPSKLPKRSFTLLLWSLAGIHLLLLLALVFFRLLDYDEGFYLEAARQVGEGRIPYVDFFYPQSPLLPYLLSPFAGRGMETLFLSRLAGVIVALGGILCFWQLLRERTTDARVRAILLGAYALNAMILAWHSVAKGYPWSDTLVLASLLLIVRYDKKQTLGLLIMAGLLLAVANSVRAVHTPLFLWVSYHVWRYSAATARRRLRPLATFLTGTIIGFIPITVIWLKDADRFLFNNIGFHLLRDRAAPLTDGLMQRVDVAFSLLINPALLIPLLLMIPVLFRMGRNTSADREGARFDLLLCGAAIITLISSFLPSPVHQQYFVQFVPFALLGSVSTVHELASARARRLAMILVGIFYLSSWAPAYSRFVTGSREMDQRHHLADNRSAAEWLRLHASAGPLFSELPIVPVLANLPAIRGLEFGGFYYGLTLTDGQLTRYHLPTRSMLDSLIENQVPEYAILVERPDPALAPRVERFYEPLVQFGALAIWGRRRIETDIP